MIGHQAVGRHAHRARFERLLEDPLEGRIVGVLGEQPHPPHAPIQDVKRHSPGSHARGSGHARKSSDRPLNRQELDLSRFSSSRFSSRDDQAS